MKQPYPWEHGVLYLGVDPGQIKSAIAYSGRTPSGDRVWGTYAVGDITQAGSVAEAIVVAVRTAQFRRVVLAVEYPRWNVGASPVVRAAANTWTRLLRACWPRIVNVVKVDPNEWQATYDFKSRGSAVTTKEHSRFLANAVYGWLVDTDDEADAALILEHARALPVLPGSAARRKR